MTGKQSEEREDPAWGITDFIRHQWRGTNSG